MSGGKPDHDDAQKEEGPPNHQAQIWAHIRPSLRAIEDMMNARVIKKDYGAKKPALFEDAKPTKTGNQEDSEEEFYDLERSESDPTQNVPLSVGPNVSTESSIPWKEELECLVQGGVPMALRGEVGCACASIPVLVSLLWEVVSL